MATDQFAHNNNSPNAPTLNGAGILNTQIQQPTDESVRGFLWFIVELGGFNALQIHNNQLKIVRLLDLQIRLCCLCS